jgi:hypothetical protein
MEYQVTNMISGCDEFDFVLWTKIEMDHVPMYVSIGISMDVLNGIPMNISLKHCSLVVCMFVLSALVHLFLQFSNLFSMCSLM